MTNSTLAGIRRENLRALALRAGSLADINEKLGKRRKDPYLYSAAAGTKYKNGERRSLGPRLCKELERVFELPAGWMSTPHDDENARRPGLFDFAECGGLPIEPPAPTSPDEPAAPSASIDIEPLEATGAAVLIPGEDFRSAFPGRASSDFKAWIVSGEDMAPRFLAGDRVLIDTAAIEPGPGFFILEISGRRVLRKLSTSLTGELILSAEKNPGESLPLSPGMTIIGRAAYLVRAIRL